MCTGHMKVAGWLAKVCYATLFLCWLFVCFSLERKRGGNERKGKAIQLLLFVFLIFIITQIMVWRQVNGTARHGYWNWRYGERKGREEEKGAS